MSILITSKTCLFCLKTVDNLEENVTETKLDYFEKFFTFLERLLQQTRSPWMWSNPPDFRKLLNLCDDCVKVVESFCAVYHQIRCLELELNWKVETLRNVMKQADGAVASREEDCERILKCEGGGGECSAPEGGFTELHSKFRATRRNLMKQCTNYLSNLCPRIVIDNYGGTSVTSSRSRLGRQRSSSERHIPAVDDVRLKSFFMGWTMSFVAVILLFLMDSTTYSSPSNFKLNNQADAEAASHLNHADVNDYNEDIDNDENMGEVECEDDNTDLIRPEVDNGIRNDITKTTSNTETALEEAEKMTIDSVEIFIKQRDQRDVGEENGKSLEDVRRSELRLANAKEKNIEIGSSHGEPLGTTQEQEGSAPISLEEHPHIASDGSDTLKKVVQEDLAQLPSRPRQLRNIHKCLICKMTFSNLSNLERHQESCHLDNEGRGMISDDDDEDYERKFEVKRFKREEIDDFNMEWKDESAESDVSSLCDGKDLEIDLGPPGSELQEASETSSSQSQNDFGQDQKAVAKLSSQSQPRLLEDTNDNNDNSNSPNKSVKLLKKDGPKRTTPKRIKKKCPQCPFKYSNLKDFMTHTHTHIDPSEWLNFKINAEGLTLKPFVLRKKGKFSCRVKLCRKKFQTEDDFNNHSKLHGSFPCTVCGTVKEFAPDLAIHEANNRKETAGRVSTISKIFNCARCPHKAGRRNRCIDHLLKTHLGISNDKIRCPICSAVFNEPAGNKKQFINGIYFHYATHHGGAPGTPLNTSVHKCDKCPAYFLKLTQLETHSAKEHGSGSRKQDSSTCSDCGKTFLDRKHLRIHRENFHKVEMRFPCPVKYCDKRFETEVDLAHHTTFQHGPGRTIVPCPVCGKRLSQESLKAHLRTHDPNHYKELVHKNKIICDQCGKAFKSTKHHEVHLLSHSGPESWEFTCETCGKKCISKQKLNEHQRIHTKEKPFVCDTCGQAYAHRHNLRIHVNNKHEKKDIAREYDKWKFNNYKKSSKKKKDK